MTWVEWLSRRSPTVRERLERLNGWYGPPEGCIPRGWHPHKKSAPYWRDCMAVRYFVEKYGREEYRRLPKAAFCRDGHRKAISTLWVLSYLPRPRAC